MSMASDNKDVIYIKGSNVGTSYTSDLGYFYEYDAFINGEATTIKTDAAYQITKDTLVYGPHYNAKGILIGEDAKADVDTNAIASGSTVMGNVTGTDSVVNDVIKLGTGATSSYYAYNKNVNVYFLTVDGELVKRDITNIALDSNDEVLYKIDDKGLLTDVYVKVVDTPETVTPGAGTFSAVMGKGATAGNLTLTVNSTDLTDSSSTFTAKIYAFALASGKDTAVEVGTVASQTLSLGTKTVAPAISGTNNTQVYYAVITMSDGSVVTTNTIIGG